MAPWLGLSCSLSTSWSGCVGPMWEEMEVKIIPSQRRKKNGCIRRPIWINYILGEYFVPAWIWYQLLLFNNLTGGNLVWPRHPEDLEQLQNLQRDKDRNITTQHMSPNTERDRWGEMEREKEVMNGVVFLCKEDNCILLWEQRSRRASVSNRHVSRRQPMKMCRFGSYVSLLGQSQSSGEGNSQSQCEEASGGLANEVGAWCLVPVDVWQLDRLYLISTAKPQHGSVCMYVCGGVTEERRSKN